MRWLADECVTVSLVRELRGAGHDVLYIAEFAASLSDMELIALASREGRLLLTADKDFGELVFRRGQAVPGLARISHSVEAHRGANQRKFFCEKDFAVIQECPDAGTV
ncbi:DUF5615 family PIN-like protein [Bradyrhizobium sp. RDM12]